MKIVIAGGGTGGHITPALAVASELQKRGCVVTFIGSRGGPERELVVGYPFFAITAGKLRRYFSLLNCLDAFRVVIGFFESLFLLTRLDPQVVFAKGGYVTVPVVYAAALLNIPVVAHESDAVLGLANRLIASKVKAICTGFPVSFYPRRLQWKLHFTGNPIRELFYRAPTERKKVLTQLGFSLARPTVLVMGGSQGASAINELIFSSLATLLKEVQLIHLTGKRDRDKAEEQRARLPRRLAQRYQVYDFVTDELAEFLTVADVVVSRASANALAELAYLQKAVILIPLPLAASDHQRANAAIFTKKQAAIVLFQDQLTGDSLTQVIFDLLEDPKQRQDLSRSIHSLSSPSAGRVIAEIVISWSR